MNLLTGLVTGATEREDGILTPRNVRIASLLVLLTAEIVSLFTGDALHFALGLFLGGAVAQLLFLQNQKSVEKIVKMTDPQKAEFVSRRDYYIRLFFRGAALVIGYLNPYTNLIGVIIGLMSITVGIYIMAVISYLKMRKASVNETIVIEASEEVKSDHDKE